MRSIYDPGCRRCTRLAAFLDAVRRKQPGYFCKPVAPFGDPKAPLVIVGLAPGMHGANRTGRPFTGDHAGILLYGTLYKFGLASAASSVSAEDGLTLRGARITNSVKCVPPQNKPLPEEVKACNGYLEAELAQSPQARVILALGAIAHNAVLRAHGLGGAAHRFAHGAEHALSGGRILLDSYHCSRYNTQTRRLTVPMFEAVIERALALIGTPAARAR
ncbi:MAG TPA: uracil-DNA glycosylase [Steroidobacteraceae bacterium]|nr:uracil-DNA glycosylase [Steroidobacteraceae bacterium]